jgi:beta-galactosidase
VDLTGWRKPASHYRAIVWDRGEKLYAAVRTPSPDGKPWGLTKWSTIPELPSWTWPGQEGKSLTVDVYSRYPSVRLYLNGKLLGEKTTDLAAEFKATFEVPYEPGKLEAVGVAQVFPLDVGFNVTGAGSAKSKSPEVRSFKAEYKAPRIVLKTATTVSAIRLVADHTTLRGDGQDLAFLTLEVTDPAGTLNPTENPAVRISVTGPGTVAGIANADMTSMEPYYANPRHTFQGRSLVVIRTQHAAGWIKVTASAPGLSPAHVTLRTTPQP